MHVEPDEIRRVLAQTRKPPPVTASQAASCAEMLAESATCSAPVQGADSQKREATEHSLCAY